MIRLSKRDAKFATVYATTAAVLYGLFVGLAIHVSADDGRPGLSTCVEDGSIIHKVEDAMSDDTRFAVHVDGTLPPGFLGVTQSKLAADRKTVFTVVVTVDAAPSGWDFPAPPRFSRVAQIIAHEYLHVYDLLTAGISSERHTLMREATALRQLGALNHGTLACFRRQAAKMAEWQIAREETSA